MTSQTNEQALESAIEKCLTGKCQEEIKAAGAIVSERDPLYKGGNGIISAILQTLMRAML